MTGGCASARIARPAYRNFFTPDRSDVFAGFRACAVSFLDAVMRQQGHVLFADGIQPGEHPPTA